MSGLGPVDLVQLFCNTDPLFPKAYQAPRLVPRATEEVVYHLSDLASIPVEYDEYDPGPEQKRCWSCLKFKTLTPERPGETYKLGRTNATRWRCSECASARAKVLGTACTCARTSPGVGVHQNVSKEGLHSAAEPDSD